MSVSGKYAALMVASLFTTSVPAAQTPEDYKAAASARGCNAIPYSSLRSECIQEQADTKEWCDGKGDMGCQDLKTSGLVEQLREMEKGIQTANAEKRTEAASDLESKKKLTENQIAGNKKEAERRAYNNYKCLEFRERVRKVFIAAENRAAAERSLASNGAIHDDLDKILSELRSGAAGHQTQIQQVERRLETCKNP